MTKSYLNLELTAPGKIILFGEHSVVYGKKAVAATLGLYTKLRLTENGSNVIALEFPSLGLEESFPVSSVREHFPTEKGTLQSTVEAFDRFYSQHGTKSLTEGQRYSLLTFFHSFARIPGPCTGLTVRVETELPVSSGAGSSASFSVIVSTAAVLLELVESDKLWEFVSRNDTVTITDKLRDMIAERAFSCECIFHGTPSGIDHSVILHGSALEFVKRAEGNKLEPVDGGTVKVMLVNTKVPRSTRKQVEILKKWKEKHPEAMDNILNAMESIARDGIETLRDLKRNPNDLERNESRLADLIDLNHGLLRAFGTSHESLEKICSVARAYGLSAKLTGAGGGGLGFVYIPSRTPSETLSRLKEELEQAGFEASEVVLGGPGLRIKHLSLSGPSEKIPL